MTVDTSGSITHDVINMYNNHGISEITQRDLTHNMK